MRRVEREEGNGKRTGPDAIALWALRGSLALQLVLFSSLHCTAYRPWRTVVQGTGYAVNYCNRRLRLSTLAVAARIHLSLYGR
jgi:hypothetical protein